MSMVVQARLGAARTGQHANASTETALPTETALRERLHARVEGCRRDIAGELAVIEALVRMGELDGAAHALEDQRRALRTLNADLAELIAGATSSRPAAERPAPAMAEPRPWGRMPAVASSALRLASPRLVAALAAVLMSFGLALPTLQQRPIAAFGLADASREETASAFHEARERLADLERGQANADLVTSEARVLHDQILSLSDDALADAAVRGEIQQLLTEQSAALLPLLGNGNKAAELLFAEVRALTASLDFDLPALPELPTAPLPAPAAEPAKLLPAEAAPAKPKAPTAPSAPSTRAPQDEWPSLLEERQAPDPGGAKAHETSRERAARHLEESRERSDARAASGLGG